ncbi:MAG: UDP-glucose/GDP-mannose dehydrogenase family protein [Thermomicrobiales bacterium]
MASVAIVGVGYVGLVYGAALADLGNRVYGIDIDQEKIDQLSQGVTPIFEPGLDELVATNLKSGRLTFTSDYGDAIPNAEFVFICVDTPSALDGEADMRAVRAAAGMIGSHLTGHTVIIDKSTMPIGAGDVVTDIIAAHKSDDATFGVVSNPEFLREGSAVHDVFHPSRIVLGSDDPCDAERVKTIFEALDSVEILVTDRRSAEMIKYASNAMLATRISFINEMAQISEHLGADIKAVARGMGLDPRIGPRFLEAGIGFGGSCFPKDVKALAYMAREAGCHPQLLDAVMEINQDQRRLFVHRLQNIIGDVFGKRIAVWGLSFKENTDDIREAPAIDIIGTLVRRGARISAFDPAATERARSILPNIDYAEDPYGAVVGADALLVTTPWNVFKHADLNRVRDLMHIPVILDGRNLYDPDEVRELGFVYTGIGRGHFDAPPMQLGHASVETTGLHDLAAVGDD